MHVVAWPVETVSACGHDLRHHLASFEVRGGAVTGEAGIHQKESRVSGVSRRKPGAGAHAGGGNSVVHGPNSDRAVSGVLESPGKISNFPWKNVLEWSADPSQDKKLPNLMNNPYSCTRWQPEAKSGSSRSRV